MICKSKFHSSKGEQRYFDAMQNVSLQRKAASQQEDSTGRKQATRNKDMKDDKLKQLHQLSHASVAGANAPALITSMKLLGRGTPVLRMDAAAVVVVL